MKSMTGMSLFELLISLGILAILISSSIPDFSELTESISGKITLRKLATAVQLGKSTAITNDITVTLCKSVDGLACGGLWQDGVLIFTDQNRDAIINDNDKLVRHITFPDSNGHIKFRAFQNKQALQYFPRYSA